MSAGATVVRPTPGSLLTVNPSCINMAGAANAAVQITLPVLHFKSVAPDTARFRSERVTAATAAHKRLHQ
jgi:hypothetical protein